MSKKGSAVSRFAKVIAKMPPLPAKSILIKALSPPISASQSHIRLLWLKTLVPPFCLLPNTIIREICEYFRDKVTIPFISAFSGYLSFYSLETKTWEGKISPTHSFFFSSVSRCVPLGTDRLFICGGTDTTKKSAQPAWTCACIVYRSGKIVAFPNMRKARHSHGLVETKATIYAFGGFDYRPAKSPGTSFALNSCECVPLTNPPVWRLTANMNTARYSFSPCVWKGDIYIVDGDPMEVFSLSKETFKEVRVRIPNLYAATTYVHRGDLVVFNDSYRAVLGMNGEVVVSSSTYKVQLTGRTQSIVAEGKVYADTEKGLGVFDASTGELCEEIHSLW